MDSVIIAWTPTNWLTVFLMAAGGFVLIKVAVMVIKKVQESNSNA
jgi:hypothetical protein